MYVGALVIQYPYIYIYDATINVLFSIYFTITGCGRGWFTSTLDSYLHYCKLNCAITFLDTFHAALLKWSVGMGGEGNLWRIEIA